MNTEKTLIAISAGIATGILAGILIAPEKGSSTRKKISEKSDDYLSGIKKEFNQLRKDLNTRIEASSKELKELNKKSKEKTEKLNKKTKEAFKGTSDNKS